MHERHFRIDGGGKGESGKSGLREMFSGGGGLSRRSGRSNLKGGDYDGGASCGGGRGMSSGSTYGGSSMGYGVDPPLMLEESRGRSGSSLFSRSGSKAGSSAGTPHLDYGYDPQPSRSRSKAGSDIGSAFSRGSSKARSMFSGGGYSSSRELVPVGLPNPPSTGSRRGSQYEADMSGFSRAEGYAKDYYAPPSNTGSRGSSHRSSSHSRTIYPESSVSGTSSSMLRGLPSVHPRNLPTHPPPDTPTAPSVAAHLTPAPRLPATSLAPAPAPSPAPCATSACTAAKARVLAGRRALVPSRV